MTDLVEIRVSVQAWSIGPDGRRRLPERDEVLVRLKAWPEAPIDWPALMHEAVEASAVDAAEWVVDLDAMRVAPESEFMLDDEFLEMVADEVIPKLEWEAVPA